MSGSSSATVARLAPRPTTSLVYRLVPAAGQQPIRLEFTSEDGSTHFTSDDFDPMVEGALYNEYTMGIYAGDVNLNQILMDITIDGKTYTKVVNVETSTLQHPLRR